MAFTAEELMLMQEEAEREHQASLEVSEGKASGADSTTKETSGEEKDETSADKKEEDAKGGEAKAKEDEKGAAGGEQGGKKEKEEVIQDDEEVRELREISRAQKLELDRMSREYERLNKILKDKGLIDEEDESARKAQEEASRANYERRVAVLSDMLEVMKVNPKYEDVDEVVSQRNFDDMVTALAKYHVSQKGGDVQATMTEIEKEIWALPNPYKYMYDMIKKYHPVYVSKKEEKSILDDVKEVLEKGKSGDKGKESAKGKEADKSKDAGKPKEQAMSLQDLPGGGSKDGGGWTAAKIDAMDEEELSKVPRDIYSKYMRGELQ